MGRRRKLQDATVVVTGASSGIGRATVEALAAAGATVVATARREAALRELAEQCTGAEGGVHPMPADVTDLEAVEELARETVGRFGRLDAWVNNAGVNQYGRFEEVPFDEWRRVIEVNLLGQAHGARAAIPYFREQGEGVLVNVSSVLAKVASPLQSAYVASKFGVRGLSDSLRQELQDVPGVHVANVMPGPIDTPLFQHAANHTGHRIKAPAPTVDATRVAAAILRVIVAPEDEVGVGLNTRLGLTGNRVAPRITDRVAAPMMVAAHLDDDEFAPPTSGTLFEPMDEGAEVSGGWKPLRAGRPGRTVAMLATAAAVATATAAGLRSRDGR
jgi:NAD(P)-dependent dehydrogenase (short-subunit alcohol dehydrogenase family)